MGGNNERGSTLVVVLLSITLIMIFATVITSQVLSTSKQVKTTENFQVATDVAEMGIDYFLENVIKQVNFTNNIPYKNPCLYMKDVANSLPKTNPIDSQMINSGASFELSDYQCSPDNSIFSFKSTGKAGLNNTKEINISFPINIEHGFPERPPGFIDCDSETDAPCRPVGDVVYDTNVYFPSGLVIEKVRGTTTTVTSFDSLYVYGKLYMKGENKVENPNAPEEYSEFELYVKNDVFIDGMTDVDNHGTIYVGRDLHVNWGLDDANHADIIVERDAYFYQKTILTKPNSFICVKGTLYMPKDSDFSKVKKLGGKSCETLRTIKSEDGIYADRVLDIATSSEINILLDELNVEY